MKIGFLIITTIFTIVIVWALVRLMNLDEKPTEDKFRLYIVSTFSTILLYIASSFAVTLMP